MKKKYLLLITVVRIIHLIQNLPTKDIYQLPVSFFTWCSVVVGVGKGIIII
jgi:hypothetical protein